MDRISIEQILHSAGFKHTGSSGLGHTYRLDLSNKHSISASASIEGVRFFGTSVDQNKIKRVSFSLEAGGTTYRFYSEKALMKHLDDMISELRRVSENPDLLKCPECGLRNVHMKEPLSNAGKQFKPFLSCDGMQVQRSGRKKEIACYGTSNKLPALINYE